MQQAALVEGAVRQVVQLVDTRDREPVAELPRPQIAADIDRGLGGEAAPEAAAAVEVKAQVVPLEENKNGEAGDIERRSRDVDRDIEAASPPPPAPPALIKSLVRWCGLEVVHCGVHAFLCLTQASSGSSENAGQVIVANLALERMRRSERIRGTLARHGASSIVRKIRVRKHRRHRPVFRH